MEGNNVYLCKWSRAGKKYRLWLDAKQDVVVEHSEFEAASDALVEKIADCYRDFEAVLEFDPPKPFPRAGDFPEIAVLGHNEFVDRVDIDTCLFDGGCCPTCDEPVGPRNGRQLIIDKYPKNNTAAVRNCSAGFRIFSEQFVDLLTREEKDNLMLREIAAQSTGPRKFFEVTGAAVARFVGVKGATYSPLSCWHCPTCHAQRIYPRMGPGPMFGISQFVCNTHLPKPVPTVLILGGRGMPLTPCMLKSRWREMIRNPSTKGVVTHPVGVIASNLADYGPLLPTYSKR